MDTNTNRWAYLHLRDKLDAIRGMIAQSRMAVYEPKAISRMIDLRLINEEIAADADRAWATLPEEHQENTVLETFRALLERADRIVTEVADIRGRAIDHKTLAQAGFESGKENIQGFLGAREYHRGRAGWMLAAMLTVLALAAATVIQLFYAVDQIQVVVENGKARVVADSIYWARLGLFVGGRAVIIGGLAWALRFFGKLHSKHSQQAITYHDRLAGLQAADTIIFYGSAKSREHLLQEMAKAYLTPSGNAFADVPREPSLSVKELKGLAESAVDLAGRTKQVTAPDA